MSSLAFSDTQVLLGNHKTVVCSEACLVHAYPLLLLPAGDVTDAGEIISLTFVADPTKPHDPLTSAARNTRIGSYILDISHELDVETVLTKEED